MAVRIPWDKYEAAILLDACLRVEHGEIERIFISVGNESKPKGLDSLP